MERNEKNAAWDYLMPAMFVGLAAMIAGVILALVSQGKNPLWPFLLGGGILLMLPAVVYGGLDFLAYYRSGIEDERKIEEREREKAEERRREEQREAAKAAAWAAEDAKRKALLAAEARRREEAERKAEEERKKAEAEALRKRQEAEEAERKRQAVLAARKAEEDKFARVVKAASEANPHGKTKVKGVLHGVEVEAVTEPESSEAEKGTEPPRQKRVKDDRLRYRRP